MEEFQGCIKVCYLLEGLYRPSTGCASRSRHRSVVAMRHGGGGGGGGGGAGFPALAASAAASRAFLAISACSSRSFVALAVFPFGHGGADRVSSGFSRRQPTASTLCRPLFPGIPVGLFLGLSFGVGLPAQLQKPRPQRLPLWPVLRHPLFPRRP